MERLGLWILRRFAPIVAADHPDGIVIDSAGADHLHGGEAAMLNVMIGRHAMSGIAACAANRDAAALVAAREDRPNASLDDLWRRAGVPVAAFTRLAEADAFRPAFGLARREALWAIRRLRDEPLPLFAAAAKREAQVLPEAIKAAVTLRPMTTGREVVEDYGHIGLSLRAHPISILRADLARRRIVPSAEAMESRLETAGLNLVRQRPGSAKGVLLATIEDESGIANVVVFEKYRRGVLSSAMLCIRGRIQREGEVVHLVAHHLTDLSTLLKTVGHREGTCPLPHWRGDELHHGSPRLDPRERPKMPAGHNVGDRYGHLDEIKVNTRDFRSRGDGAGTPLDAAQRSSETMSAIASMFSQSFFHGTKADLKPGDLIVAGHQSNFLEGRPLSWVYCAATLDAAIWGAELSACSGRERIYVVEPTGPIEDDPNLTDKKFPGNPTLSYRSRDPLRVIAEVTMWQGHPPERLQQMKDGLARLKAEGAEIIDKRDGRPLLAA